jgi:hypothetical protein
VDSYKAPPQLHRQTTIDLWKCLLAFARYVKTQCRRNRDRPKKSMAAFGDQLAKIVSQLQTILKKEWERVKKGG